MTEIDISSPLSQAVIGKLRTGEAVRISGDIYTARDAAHKRMVDMAKNGEAMPFNFSGSIVYYAGPCPCPPHRVSSSVGPTTSGRMDSYTPTLMALGLRAMIGKGTRSEQVKEAIKTYGGIYFAAIGGAGALLAMCVTHSELVAFADLGAEAVYRLTVRQFPAVVAIDSLGTDIYSETHFE